MRPMRAGRRFNFPQINSMAVKLAIGLVAGSIVYGLAGSYREFIALVPGTVWGMLRVWQPLSYVFIDNNPMGIIFGAIILWSIGGGLEMSWGGRRLLMFAVGTTFLAGVLTTLLALAWHSLLFVPFVGGHVMASALWVAYGLSFGRAQTNFWGMPVSGNVLALIGAGFVVLSGLFGGWVIVVPDLFALALTGAYMKGASPRMAWLRFSTWKLQREMKSRSTHLRLITKDRNTPSDSDRFLH